MKHPHSSNQNPGKHMIRNKTCQHSTLMNNSTSVQSNQGGLHSVFRKRNRIRLSTYRKATPYTVLARWPFIQIVNSCKCKPPRKPSKQHPRGLPGKHPTFHRSRRNSICFRHVHLPSAQVFPLFDGSGQTSSYATN